MKKFFKTYRITNKNSTFIQKIKYIIILAVMIISANTFGQKDCYNAVELTEKNGISENYLENNEFWYSYRPDSAYFYLSIIPLQSNSAGIETVNLYGNSCDDLILITSINLTELDSIIINYDMLAFDSYYIQIIGHNGNFALYCSNQAASTSQIQCSQPVCEYSPNGNFENISTLLGTALNTTSPTTEQTNLILNPLINESQCCNWFEFTGSPQIFREGTYPNYNYFLHMWTDTDLNDGTNYICHIESAYNILSGPTVPNGNTLSANVSYDLTFNWRENSYGGVSGLRVYLIDKNLLSNINFNPLFITSTQGQLIDNITLNGTILNWTPETLSFICQNADFNALLFVPYQNTPGDVGIFQLDDVKIIKTVLPLNITASWTNQCQSLADFHFIPPTTPNITYTWTFPNGTIVIPPTTNIGDRYVNWNNMGAGDVIVEGCDQNNCLIYKGIKNWNDCVQGAIQLNSLTATQIIAIYGLSTINTNNPIVFNGLITINENLTFNNCPNIKLGTNARINIMPGKTLTFNNCTLSQACDCPWDGIYTEDFTSKIILNNSTVRDAKNAVVSANGGNFNITGTHFINNKVGLYIRNYNPDWIYDFMGNKIAPPSHPGFINSSTIKKDVLYPGYYLADPVVNGHLSGIIVDTVYKLTIGDPIDINNKNHFLLLNWGIRTKKSEVYIYNNSFVDIYHTSLNTPNYIGSEPNEAAIYCKTEVETVQPPDIPLVNRITIGGGTLDNDSRLNFISNTNTGIYSYNCKMDIINNDIHVPYTGIHIKDFSSPSTISYNTMVIISKPYIHGYEVRNSAIVAEQTPTNASVVLDINNNTIGTLGPTVKLRTGVFVRNCSGNNNGSSYCKIQNNQLSFINIDIQNEYYYGISVSNCNYSQISNNAIVFNSAVDNNYHYRLQGICVNFSQNAKVFSNILLKMGDGIYINGSSLGSQFYCNGLDKCWYGFYFNSGYISNQLINQQNLSNDNYFYDIPTVNSTSAKRRLSGNLISTNTVWFHQGLNTDYNNIFSPYLVTTHPLFDNSNIQSNGNQLPNSNCGNIQPPSYFSIFENSSTDSINLSDSSISIPVIANVSTREQLIGKIVKNHPSFQIVSHFYKYLAKEFAYKLIDEIPAFKILGTSEDNLYQGFYNANNNSSVGKFNQIGKLIKASNYNAAINLNLSINGQNTIENNRIAVNHIYLNKVINNQFFGTADSLTLVNIALQSPLTGGDAVFSARVMLGIDPIISNMDYVTTPGHNAMFDENSTIKVYPNPANEVLYIETDKETEGMLTVEIFNTTANLIYSKNINAGDKYQTIDISNIRKGIYYIRISNKDAQLYNQKLVIIK